MRRRPTLKIPFTTRELALRSVFDPTVPSEVGLAPETIDLSPFEVIEGRRFADVRDGPWRFFQYHYTLRVIDEDAFGEDLEIPALELQYHIERSLDGREGPTGLEQR